MRAMPNSRAAGAAAVGLTLLLMAGCGNDGLGKRYPVSGRVTYKGSPVPAGTITFLPEDAQARPATGTIADGSYQLTTLSPGDGAFPGKYHVTVAAIETDTSAVRAAPNSLGRLKKIATANLTAKSRLPARYLSPDTSGLVREILPQKNQLDFDLAD